MGKKADKTMKEKQFNYKQNNNGRNNRNNNQAHACNEFSKKKKKRIATYAQPIAHSYLYGECVVVTTTTTMVIF